MIHFFYGDDTFTLLQKVSELKRQFLRNHPQGNLEEIVVTGGQAEKDMLQKLTQSFQQAGLFEAATLVVLQDVSSYTKKLPKVEEYLLELVKKDLGDEKTLVIADTVSVDKRLKLFKSLKKSATTEEFPVPEGAELKKWITDRLKSEGFGIEDSAVNKLLELMGSNTDEQLYDLWQVSRELEKLMLYKWDEKQIEISDVEELVKPNITENVFALTNLFADGKAVESIRLLEQMIGRVPDTDLKNRCIVIVGALASQIRSLLLVKSMEKKSPEEIAEKLEWKQGRIWINQKLAKKFSEDKLVQMLKDLRKIDLRLKTSEEPPRLLLQLFIQKAKV